MSHYGGPRLRDPIPREMQDTTGYFSYTCCCWDKGPGQKPLKGKESILARRKAWKPQQLVVT